MARVNVYRHDDYEGKTLDGWFDNSTAEWFKENTYWDGNNHRGVISGLQCGHEGLYRTKGGRWVRKYDARNEFNGPLTYEFLTNAQAKEWLLRNKDDGIVEMYFGEIEDERGPGRPEVGKPINVRLGDDLLAKVDADAKESGRSRADMLREIVARAYTPTHTTGFTAHVNVETGSITVISATYPGYGRTQAKGDLDAHVSPWGVDEESMERADAELANMGWRRVSGWRDDRVRVGRVCDVEEIPA